MDRPPQTARVELELEVPAGGVSSYVWRRFRRHRAGMISATVMVVILIAIVIGPMLWPIDYKFSDLSHVRQPPSTEHPFGTDALGRDILARVLVAGQVSLAVAFISQAIAITFAVALGLWSALASPRIDRYLMRGVDLFIAIPDLLLLILLLPALTGALESSWAPVWLSDLNRTSSGVLGLVIGIGILSWTMVTRLVRGVVLSLREQDFVFASVSIGSSRLRIAATHLLPNLRGILVVSATLGVPRAILLESGMGFLGLGVVPPLPSWGSMISDALPVMRSSPHVLLFPALFLGLTVLCLNLAGDGLRDALDPKTSI